MEYTLDINHLTQTVIVNYKNGDVLLASLLDEEGGNLRQKTLTELHQLAKGELK